MYYVYEISSLGKKYIYVGITSNLSARLKRHNSGHERTTRPYRQFIINEMLTIDIRMDNITIEILSIG